MPFIYDPLSEFGLQDYVERARDWKGDAGELKHLVREIADAYISNHDDIALAIARELLGNSRIPRIQTAKMHAYVAALEPGNAATHLQRGMTIVTASLASENPDPEAAECKVVLEKLMTQQDQAVDEKEDIEEDQALAVKEDSLDVSRDASFTSEPVSLQLGESFLPPEDMLSPQIPSAEAVKEVGESKKVSANWRLLRMLHTDVRPRSSIARKACLPLLV